MNFKSTLTIATLFLSVGICAAQTFAYEVFEKDLPTANIYKERRQRLLDSLSPRSIAVIQSADERNRQNDVDYEYRQNSNMLYLTGYPHPAATLLLIPAGITLGKTTYHEIMFVADRNPDREQWTGVSAGPEETMSVYGLDTALTSSQLLPTLAKLLGTDSSAEHSSPGEEPVADSTRSDDSIQTLLLDSWTTKRVGLNLLGKNLYIDKEIRDGLGKRFAGLEVKAGIDALTLMREIKDTSELRLMRKAIDISVKGHSYAMARTRQGMREYEIEALVEYGFKSLGAEDVGYPSIVGSGYNSCILHYNTNRRSALSGDLILSDCGAEYHGYTADITRTFPIGGHFTPDQRIIYDVVLEAQDSGIAACRSGAPFRASHRAALSVIQRRLMELKIISDTSETKKYFMHGTSHYLGLDVHDVGMKGPLRPNTVLTVEPGIYIPNGSACDTRWWNIGVRIEDDVLVTSGEPELLSRDLPRSAEDIERMVGSSFRKR